MTKTLHIFEPTFDVSPMVPNSILLTSTDQALNHNQYHTSVVDLPVGDIIAMAKLFDQIQLIDHGFDKSSATWMETKLVLNYLCHSHCVLNYHCDLPLTFTSHSGITSKDIGKKLWIFGCSHSHGTGLIDINHRFGQLLAEQLNLPVNFVTKPGSSLHWSLRHILNANISTQDVVVWQVTTPYRLTLYQNTTREVMLAASNDRCLLEVFNDQQVFFHHCSLIDYGVKYLRAKNIKFVIASILNQQALFYNYLEQYSKYPEYCYMPECNLDLATDQLHVGPLSHKAIAQRLLNHLQLYDD